MAEFRLLSTKILRPSDRRRFLALGVSYVEHDFLCITHQRFDKKIPPKKLIFTSQNAVYAVLDSLKSAVYSCYCVGEKTKQLLTKNGQKVLKMSENAADLSHFLTKLDQKDAFLFFTGNHRRPNIETALRQSNHSIEVIEVYQSSPSPKSFGDNNGVLFFSPNGVKSFMEMNNLQNTQAFAIGETTAQMLEEYTQNIITASQPSVEYLLIALKKHLQTLC